MNTFQKNQIVYFPEHDGIIKRTVKDILWSEKGIGKIYYSKEAVLLPALEWCIVLFDDGTFFNGSDIPLNENPYK